MARARKSTEVAEEYEFQPLPPVMTPEDQEDQLISLAVNLAVKRLQEGTASNQLVSEIIKLGTQKERLAREKLERENELLRAKTEAIAAAKDNGEKYMRAIQAMREYAGYGGPEYDDFEEDY